MKISTNFKDLQGKSFATILPYLQKEKTRTYSSLVFSLLAIMFFGIFAINPTLSTITNLQRQIKDNQEIYDKLQKKIASLTSLRSEYEKIKFDIPIIDDALPQEPSVTLLTAQIQAIGQNANVTINKLQVQEIELANRNPLAASQNQLGADQYSAFTFSVDAIGSYENIIDFVAVVGNFQRLTTIEAVSITTNEDIIRPNNITIRAQTYYKR